MPPIAEEHYLCIRFSGIKIADNAPIIWNIVRQMIDFFDLILEVKSTNPLYL